MFVAIFTTVPGECDNDSALVPGTSGGGGGTEGESGSGGVLGSQTSGGDPAAAEASDPAADEGTLPFTGFAAIGLACIGIVLAAGGLLVRALEGRPEHG